MLLFVLLWVWAASQPPACLVWSILLLGLPFLLSLARISKLYRFYYIHLEASLTIFFLYLDPVIGSYLTDQFARLTSVRIAFTFLGHLCSCSGALIIEG
jgi:hypothetical protein